MAETPLTPPEADASPTTARPALAHRRIRAIVAAALLLALCTSCVLWNETHFRIEQGKNTYVYIHATPSNQMRAIAAYGCKPAYDVACTSGWMRKAKIKNGFAQSQWNAAWSSPHAQEAVLQLRSRIGANRCMVMVRLAGVTLRYRWQTRRVWDDGCRHGQPFG
jgi:hypothetical protein